KLFKEYLEMSGFDDCETFNVITESSSLTTIIQTIIHAPKEDTTPTVSIASYKAIQEYVEDRKLFVTRLPKQMKRTLYIAYLKERKHDAFIDTVLNFLMTIK
ncbi:MAG: LysR family transcriptional regulator, partial [Arcobacteraceae bacterium]|nr:LysR family transcriptional regulator [Arcobacteraceae bacterium]